MKNQTTSAATAFNNIIALLKGALHPGAHSQHVAAAIDFLEQLVKHEESLNQPKTPADEAAIEKAEKKRKAKAEKVKATVSEVV